MLFNSMKIDVKVQLF